MKVLYSFIILSFLSFTCLYAQGIKFETGSWTEIKAKAKKENKLIFIDCSADWCKPCKQMEKEVFINDSVGAFFNKNFICVKQDIETPTGRIFFYNYKLDFIPAFLFIDANDSLYYKEIGYKSIKDFLSMGEKIARKDFSAPVKIAKEEEKPIVEPKTIDEIKALAEKNFVQAYPYLCQNIQALDKEFIYKMVRANGGKVPKKTNTLLELYYMQFPLDTLFSPLNIRRTMYGISSIENTLFKLVLNNPHLLPNNYKDSLNRLITTVTMNDVNFSMIFTAEPNIEAYKKVNQFVLKYPFLNESVKYSFYVADHEYYPTVKTEWKQYGDFYANERGKYLEEAEEYNTVAWNFYRYIDNPAHLEKAVGWARKAVELQPKPIHYYTLAHLLWKTNKKAEAIKMQEKAIALAKEAKDDAALYVEALQKIKNGK